MQKVLVNRLGGLSLPRKSVARLTDRPDMTLDVYRGQKTTQQQKQQCSLCFKTIYDLGVRGMSKLESPKPKAAFTNFFYFTIAGTSATSEL